MTTSFSHCDSNSLPTTTKATSLTPNQFHKLCPALYSSGTTLGQPQCGDGSAFSFFFTRPPARLDNAHKLLIEFQGGGACWDSNTCNMQKDYLTFPPHYDDFVGKSCSEIEYGMQNSALGMLCAKVVGSTNFQEYNTIVVPYCTQDVHIGDSFISYDDDGGSNGDTVRHVGAHNMYRTLQWIFANFPNPTHIFLTGCSAGGTAVPIAYDLINKHYNTFLKGSGTWPRAVNINVMMDSSVYLCPEYFLQNYYGNWNPATIMQKIQFNYNKYRYSENYPDILWDHILRRGPNSDRWGFVTHSDDPISLMYFQYMRGNGDANNRRSLASTDSNNMTYEQLAAHEIQSYRQLGDDDQSLWWSGIQSSMTIVKTKHKNVDFYVIDGEGHCSFGLYYPLRDEGFEKWASPIVKEGVVVGNNRPSAASFLTSIVLGGLFMLLIRTASSQRNRGKLLTDDDTFGTDANRRATRMPTALLRIKGIVLHQASKFSSYPWTASYLLTTTVYFICMLSIQGFAHPLENPAVGPSAVGLSSFGINNPALVVYKMEHYRLITSAFLCSGIITYLLVLYTMYKKVSALESALVENGQPHWVFLLVGIIISMGVNLSYAFVGKGASCTSLALVIGLNVFSGVLQRRSASLSTKSYPVSWGFTALLMVVGSSPLFPFDTVVALCSSVAIGSFAALLLFETGQSELQETENENTKQPSTYSSERRGGIRWNFVKGIGVAYFTMYLLLIFRVPSPDKNNIHPYLTGCSLVYSDQISEFVEHYASNYGRRELGGNEDLFGGQNMCAQLCVPHVVYRPALWGVRKFGLIELEEGSCEENGYDVHVADKTVREYTVTLEVQVFTQSED